MLWKPSWKLSAVFFLPEPCTDCKVPAKAEQEFICKYKHESFFPDCSSGSRSPPMCWCLSFHLQREREQLLCCSRQSGNQEWPCLPDSRSHSQPRVLPTHLGRIIPFPTAHFAPGQPCLALQDPEPPPGQAAPLPRAVCE